jgi:hypothetical protein
VNYREAISTAYNESDVEQKLVHPLLTLNKPIGFGFLLSEIRTKADLHQFVIGKGKEQKLYYPDYIAILAGPPVAVIEVKGPEEALEPAFREARLYAGELNSQFPSKINPVRRILCINGREVWAGYYQQNTTLKNAEELVLYLERVGSFAISTSILSNSDENKQLMNINDAIQVTKKLLSKEEEENPWFKVEERLAFGSQLHGTVTSVKDFGTFVQISPGIVGLIPVRKIESIRGQKPIPGDHIIVQIERINEAAERMSLNFIGFD